MNETVRTFIAIELNQEIRDTIKNAQDFMKRFGLSVKWVKPENVHLTLKFLGNVGLDKIESITKILKNCCNGLGSIDSEITSIGTFPEGKRPNIIWIGATDPQNKIKNLSSIIDNKLSALGFKKEKREFKPHITIGRVKSIKDEEKFFKSLADCEITRQRQNINNFSIFGSKLSSAGPAYKKISLISLI